MPSSEMLCQSSGRFKIAKGGARESILDVDFYATHHTSSYYNTADSEIHRKDLHHQRDDSSPFTFSSLVSYRGH